MSEFIILALKVGWPTIFILASFWSHPIAIGTAITLITSLILFLIKKVADLVGTVEKVDESIKEKFPVLEQNQIDLKAKLETVEASVEKVKVDQVTLTDELREHMKGEENVVTDILSAVSDLGNLLDHQALSLARNAFRQSAFHSETAFYDSELVDGVWVFMWGNESYFKLSGLTLAQAKADLFWDVNILEKERTYFRRTLTAQANRGENIDVEYTHVQPDGEHKQVRLSAVPALNKDGKPSAYFGAIKVLEKRHGLGKGPGHRS